MTEYDHMLPETLPMSRPDIFRPQAVYFFIITIVTICEWSAEQRAK